MNLTEILAGTSEAAFIQAMQSVYAEIDCQQKSWKQVTPAQCPDGCGSCCVKFEPDITEQEALFTAAWLLENKPDWADAICDGTFNPPRSYSQKGCIFFNPDSAAHCTIYDGRMLICRLFGFCSVRAKDGGECWKPCKFISAEQLATANPSAEHRQYTGSELLSLYGAIPPVMEDLTGQAVALDPDGVARTQLIRDVLPSAIRRLKMILRFSSSSDDDDFDGGNNAPQGFSA